MEIPPLVLWINAGLTLAALAAWAAIGRKLWLRQPLISYEPRQPVPWRGSDLAITIAAGLIALPICLGLGFRLSGVEPPNDLSELSPDALIVQIAASSVAFLICAAAGGLIAVFRAGATAADLGFVFRPIKRDLLYAAAAFVALAPALYGMQYFFDKVLGVKYTHPLIEALEVRPDRTTWWLVICSAVAIAPVAEEFLFRVVLQGWLEKVELRYVRVQAELGLSEPDAEVADSSPDSVQSPSHPLPAGWLGLPLGSGPILVSAALFGVMHWGHGAAPAALFIFGLAMGYLYQRTHRITAPLVAHLILNSMSTLMLYVTLRS